MPHKYESNENTKYFRIIKVIIPGSVRKQMPGLSIAWKMQKIKGTIKMQKLDILI